MPTTKKSTKVMDHHHTLCCSFASHTPIQFFSSSSFSTDRAGLTSSARAAYAGLAPMSSSDDDPTIGALAGFS